MKITGVKTFPVASPIPQWANRHWMFVRLDTSDGPSGYGEMFTSTSAFRLPLLARMIEELVEQNLLGHDPYNIEVLYDRLYGPSGRGRTSEHTKQAIMSGIEMACWDVIGKDVGKPVYQLLGGMTRDRVRSYTYLRKATARTEDQKDLDFYQDLEALAERSRHYADLGFTALKIDPFTKQGTFDQKLGQRIPVSYSLRALDQAEATIRAIREAVGSRCDIMIGTHGQMTAAGAIRAAKRFEPYEPLWFEEPVPSMNMAEMAQVARATCIPVTTGERLTTIFDFASLIDHGAASVFNLDLGQVGGILEAKKIAALAEAHYLQVSPHSVSGPVIAAASLQIAISCGNCLIQEGVERLELYSELITPAFEWVDGFIVPSGRPGLGYDLREEVLERHSPTRPGFEFADPDRSRATISVGPHRRRTAE